MEDGLHMSKFIVVGGLNKDVLGVLKNSPNFFTSNACSTKTSFGGVAYNVARQLAKRGHEVKLVSVLGADHEAELAIAEAKRYGINTSGVKHIENAQTPTYFGFCQSNGEMLIAFADMTIMELMNPAFLKSALDEVDGADGLIIDANVHKESCIFLSKWARLNKIFLGGVAVSVDKMANFLNIITDFDCLVMNQLEAKSLINSDDDAWENLNLKCGVITDGARGLNIIMKEKRHHFKAPGRDGVVDSHGAGDAFAAAIISGLVVALPLDQAVSMAFNWAGKTLQHWGCQP